MITISDHFSTNSLTFVLLLNEIKPKVLELQKERGGEFKFTDAQKEAYKTVGGTPHLDGNYTVFGEVVSGLDVVDKIAADGTVMPSKIAGKNGTISLEIQQISELHKWLMKWNNYIETAGTDEWCGMTITIKSSSLGDMTVCIGVSPEKLPDRLYKAQGSQITWQLMATKITQS